MRDRVAAFERRAQPRLFVQSSVSNVKDGCSMYGATFGNSAIGEVVHADDLVPVREQPLAKIGADEPRSPRHTDPSHWFLLSQTETVRSAWLPSNVT